MANNLLKNINLSSFSKSDELVKRIFFSLFALFVFRFCAYIPIPGIDANIIADFMQRQSKGILAMFDMFTGGSLGRMSVLTLGLMPYISASIIVQIMSYATPSLIALRKDGASGRKKLNQYTRYLTIFICAIQAYGICVGMPYFVSKFGLQNPVMIGSMFPVIGVPTLVGSTMFLMWLGEQITARGLGNGVSLLIFAGIVAHMPSGLGRIFAMIRSGALPSWIIFVIAVFVIALVALIVFFERAQRRVKFMYPSKRASGQGGLSSGESTHLPLKINASGVIPPIFAGSLISLPMTVLSFSKSEDGVMAKIMNIFTMHGGLWYNLIFAALIVFFAFFYTAIVFNSEETADNLKKSGGFVPGVRPGVHTSDYFDYILTRITVVGSIYLVAICILPQMFVQKLNIPVYLSGTSVLIVVSVAIDTVTRIYTYLISQQYSGLLRKHNRRLERK